eukprot:659244_1
MKIISIISALWLTQFIPPVLRAHEQLVQFGYVTDYDPLSLSQFGTSTITAWFNNKVYQCDTHPTAINTEYSCDAESSLIGCDFANSDPKILIDHPFGDAVIADRFFLETNEATYTADGFCIPQSAVLGPYGPNNHKAAAVDNICPGGDTGAFDLYYALCVDNEPFGTYGCAPAMQYVYFDVDASQPETAADWEDGSGSSISVEPCECAALGEALSHPHECVCELGDTCPHRDIGYYCNSIEHVIHILRDDEVDDPCTDFGRVCCCHCSGWCAHAHNK